MTEQQRQHLDNARSLLDSLRRIHPGPYTLRPYTELLEQILSDFESVLRSLTTNHQQPPVPHPKERL